MRKVTTFFVLSFFSLGLACHILVPPKSQSVPNNTNVTVECLACGCSNIDMVTKKENEKPSEISNKNCILSQNDHNLTCWIVVVETTSIRCIGGANAHTSTWSTISVEMETEDLETSFFTESSSTNIAKSSLDIVSSPKSEEAGHESTLDTETSMSVFESTATPECTNASSTNNPTGGQLSDVSGYYWCGAVVSLILLISIVANVVLLLLFLREKRKRKSSYKLRQEDATKDAPNFVEKDGHTTLKKPSYQETGLKFRGQIASK